METIRYLFTVSYDGSNYSGFQRQINANSIQSEIEKALKSMTMQELTIHSAGRTDRGVHALNQTFHVDFNFEIVNIDRWLLGINKRLPSDIIIKKVKRVSNNFHARHSAKQRVYKYVISKNELNIYNHRFEVYIKDFNLELARLAKDKFVGVKDFKGFSKSQSEKDTLRVVNSIEIKETRNNIYFIFTGVSFLRYMVRSIMGTIIEVSVGKKDISVIDEIFETHNRSLAGKTAEAKALYLKKVIY